jgi:hypothetical protein
MYSFHILTFRPRSQYFFGNHIEEDHHHAALPSRQQHQHQSLHDLSIQNFPQMEPIQNPNNMQQAPSRVKESPVVQRIRARNGGSESSDLPESILSNRSYSSRTVSSRESPALKNIEDTSSKVKAVPFQVKSRKPQQSPSAVRKSSLKSIPPKDSPLMEPKITNTSAKKNPSIEDADDSEESDTDKRLNRGLQKSNQILREKYVSIGQSF